MDNRYFSRIVVDIPCICVVTFCDLNRLEFEGKIHNISESGIQIQIKKNDYEVLSEKLMTGDVVSFQAFDKYEVVSITHEDLIQGDAEVVWINSDEEEMAFGCRTNRVLPEYLSYVKNKKLALFLKGSLEIGQ